MADTFRIERSLVIQAEPATLYAMVDDFRRWREWSPYEGLDPHLGRTYSGADAGKGAVYAWDGNKKAGAGRMEIVDTAALDRITIQLDFSRPMRTRNKAEFTFVPEGGGTRVTWAMEGAKPFMFRVMSLFIDMDKMIGRDFEKGLATLKAAAESRGA